MLVMSVLLRELLNRLGVSDHRFNQVSFQYVVLHFELVLLGAKLIHLTDNVKL